MLHIMGVAPKICENEVVLHMGDRGTPKWMVKIMENPIKMDDLEGKPTIFGNIHMGSPPKKLMAMWG